MRLASSVVVMLACGFAMMRGWGIVEFVVAQRSLNANSALSDTLREWIDVPGVAGAARQALLARAQSGDARIDAGMRSEELVRLLEARPLASIDWLSLAGMRVVAAAPREEILSALTMSRISGPNEGAVMVQRGIFGLLQWEVLPEIVRSQAARDLAGAMVAGSVTDGALSVIRGVVAAKPDKTRVEIAGMLASEQVPRARLTQIGL